MTDLRKALLFLALTFAVSWAIPGLFDLLGAEWSVAQSILIAVPYMFVPMVVAIFIRKVLLKEPAFEPSDLSLRLNRWFLVAWLLPPIMAFGAFGVSLLFPGVRYAPDMSGMYERFADILTPEQVAQMKQFQATFPIHPIWLGLVQGLIAGVTINAVAGFGEELGWRGFLQKHLGFLGFWRSSLLIGLIWGVWHAPLILHGHNYPQHPVAGVFMMTAWCVLLSPIFCYVRLRAGSVIAAAIIHGTLNATYQLSVMVVSGGSDLTVGLTGTAGLIVLAVADLALLLYDRCCSKEPLTARPRETG